ncbi:hypothetical protein R9C00_23795 [Flammeovirgaceae bacterium SG7u.111]|nr:hypothetical protein [Flammeovirgaceae bacterium SG7u.132]WPO34725.1 hypothetical protein R9C00_23795 [Flammeovirgaceae bacterium SG7u.111]
MSKTTFFVLLWVAFGVWSCGNTKEQKVSSKITLSEVEIPNGYQQRFEQVAYLLDSVAITESLIEERLNDGTKFIDHLDRIRGFEAFVEYTRQKLIKLENDLGSSDGQNQLLQQIIAQYHEELEVKDSVIGRLSEQVVRYKGKNDELVRKIDLQRQEITSLEDEINEKEKELDRLKDSITSLSKKMTIAKADSYMEKAAAAEELANRTQFAPKKKKEAYQEAYQLYKLAYEAGSQQAGKKMEELKSKM